MTTTVKKAWHPCPYCGSETKTMDSAVIYGRSFGWAVVCSKYPDCDSYVGCHKGTKKPLGRLADASLRLAKGKVHALFDPMWKLKIDRDGCTKKEARTAGYLWLAMELRIPADQCHVGMFDLKMCERALSVLSRYYRQ